MWKAPFGPLNISPGGVVLQHVFEGAHLTVSELGAK